MKTIFPIRRYFPVLLGLITLLATGCVRKSMHVMDTELAMQKDIDVGLLLDTTQPLQLSVPIKNVSDRTITIQKLTKDCSCTSVHIDQYRLEPGQSGTLHIVSNLTGKSGRYMSAIVVESDAAEKIDEIQIRGRITGQVRIRPDSGTILTGDQSVPASFTVYSDNQDGKWQYTGYTCDVPGLDVRLVEGETTPITTVYKGIAEIKSDGPKNVGAIYKRTLARLKFHNAHLGKDMEINYPVEIAMRRVVAVDPAQVTFLGGESDQERTVVVQSSDALGIDAAQCAFSCIQAAVSRVDSRTMTIDLTYRPKLAQGNLPDKLSCELMSGGKTIGSIPINIFAVP